MQVDRLVALAAPDHGALEAELQVRGGPEADLLNVYPGIVGIGVAFQRSNQKLIAEGAGEQGEQRNLQRFDAVDAEGVDIFGVVGVGHAAAHSRAQPVVLLAEGNLVVEQTVGGVRLDKAHLGGRDDGAQRNGRLVVRKASGGVE